jgi:hypothetical protein
MADFWKLIDECRGNSNPMTPSADPKKMQRLIEKLPTDEVRAFGVEFYQKLIDLNRWDIWGAGYVIAGGMSDDSFHYFRSWIIGKGKPCYDAALSDPGSLLPFLDNREVENELLEYVALDVLRSRGVDGDYRDDFDCDADNPTVGEGFDEETVDEAFPQYRLSDDGPDDGWFKRLLKR